MPGHAGYLALLEEMKTLHENKAADYGVDEDPLANIRASEEIGIPAWQGAFLRALDKVRRVKAFIRNGELKNESVEDSLMDGAAYFLLALAIRREADPDEQLKQVLRNAAGQIKRKRRRRSHVSAEPAAELVGSPLPGDNPLIANN